MIHEETRKNLIVAWWNMCLKNGWATKPFEFNIESNTQHGDFSTNMALVGSKNLFKVKE